MWLWQTFKNWIQLATFQLKLQNQEFGWLWKRWVRRVFVESRSFKYKGERHDHMLHYEQVFRNIFKRREIKCWAVLMQHRCKVKGEEVITLQIAQQLKTKNINFTSKTIFCQCNANFFVRDTHTYWWSR